MRREWRNPRGTLTLHSSLAPLPHSQVDLPVPRRFFRIAARLLIQSGQPAMRRQQSGQHGDGSLKCQCRAFAMSQPCQGNSKIKMTQGQKMLQAYSLQRLLGSLFIAALAQMHHRQPKMRRRAVAIYIERALEAA